VQPGASFQECHHSTVSSGWNKRMTGISFCRRRRKDANEPTVAGAKGRRGKLLRLHVIRPEDALLDRHLSGKDQGRDAEERGNEEAVFYEAIAKAVSQAARIVLIGHGKGHSNAAQQFGDYLKKHHPLVFARVVSQSSADLGALSAHHLLELGRRALTK